MTDNEIVTQAAKRFTLTSSRSSTIYSLLRLCCCRACFAKLLK